MLDPARSFEASIALNIVSTYGSANSLDDLIKLVLCCGLAADEDVGSIGRLRASDCWGSSACLVALKGVWRISAAEGKPGSQILFGLLGAVAHSQEFDLSARAFAVTKCFLLREVSPTAFASMAYLVLENARLVADVEQFLASDPFLSLLCIGAPQGLSSYDLIRHLFLGPDDWGRSHLKDIREQFGGFVRQGAIDDALPLADTPGTSSNPSSQQVTDGSPLATWEESTGSDLLG